MATTHDSSPLPAVCLPIALDAFVLNANVCDEGPSYIAPIVQPNYVSLRLDNSQIQHDILPHIDLVNAKPSSVNPRISKTWSNPLLPLDTDDPSPVPQVTQAIDRSRLGVYLHWTIPRGYRSGASAAPQASESVTSQKGNKPDPTKQNPVFPLVPNRWLLVRILRDYQPSTVSRDSIPSAWVIESDRIMNIRTLGASVDILTDVTPFVSYSGQADTDQNILNNQAEIYIGRKESLSSWRESHPSDHVPLSIMNSSNPLFADYTPHNPNVFSTKDNFQYGTDQDERPLYLTSATCDYAIFGWHSEDDDDPLSALKNKDLQYQLQTRLKNFSLVSQPNSDGKVNIESSDASNIDRQESKGGTRIICHAARYGVRFTLDQKPPAPVDDFARLFSPDVPMEPVAVGTSPLDSVLAFLQAHQDDEAFEDTLFKDNPDVPSNTPNDRPPSAVAQALMDLRGLLYSTEDDYDAKIKAADLIYAHNFIGAGGGSAWHYDKKKDTDGPPVEPSPTEKQQLRNLNEQQRLWDGNDAKLRQLRWALFSEFFKCVSDPSNENPDSQGTTSVQRFQHYSSRVPPLRREIEDLLSQQTVLEGLMRDRTVPARKVANDTFFKRMDPTLCLAGIDGGWDPDFLQNTGTRFFLNNGLIKGPGTLQSDLTKQALALISIQLSPDISTVISGLLEEASGGYQASLAHYGHKEWTHQPFMPQFVEWEATYYHVDWERWKIGLAQSALASSNHTQVMYENNVQLSTLPDITADTRHISGRMLVLPQPSFALGAVVSQVLDTIPIDPKSSPSKASEPFNLQNQIDRDRFIAGVKKLRFISGELTGLTDALMTVTAGQHVKPNLRVQGQKVIPMAAAETAGGLIQMVHDDFVKMDGETAKTPYGTLTNFVGKPNPFKPVQHGQFAITKLTIVDKFGQAVCYPPPTRALRDESQAKLDVAKYIHPCIDEQLLPGLFNDTMNTIFTPADTHDKITKSSSGYPMTPFIQLTPAINQEARINSVFLQKIDNPDKSKSWSPCSDWENPIWGWIVVNIADSSLQFFTGDGVYYTSLTFGGPTGTIKKKDWLPFDPPSAPESLVSDQLDSLIKMMQGDGGDAYLLALWDLIRKATPTMPFPPSDYAQYANAIVGKPLALVNVGYSLELAQPPWWQQHTLPAPTDDPRIADDTDPLRIEAKRNLTEMYSFPVKIGDADRPFDGMVAYWDSDNTTPTTHFGTIYTYFPADGDKGDGIRAGIVPENYDTLKPYYLDSDLKKGTNSQTYAGSTNYAKSHIDQLKVKTVLMDPYTSIHLYSGILPIKTLVLPTWSLRSAMKNMTAFFTMGPLLITKDVPKLYDINKRLHDDSWLAGQTTNNTAATDTKPAINLSVTGTKGMWNWLQPYHLDKATADGTTPPATPGGVPLAPEMVTRFNALEVGKEDGKMRRDPGPYTFVEGFLQLARPIVTPPANTSTLVP